MDHPDQHLEAAPGNPVLTADTRADPAIRCESDGQKLAFSGWGWEIKPYSLLPQLPQKQETASSVLVLKITIPVTVVCTIKGLTSPFTSLSDG